MYVVPIRKVTFLFFFWLMKPSEEPKKKKKTKRESKVWIWPKKEEEEEENTQGASKFHTSLQICCCHKFKQTPLESKQSE